jgi:hypothetical protein
MCLVRITVGIRLSWLLMFFLSLSTSLPGLYLEYFTAPLFQPFSYGSSSFTPALYTTLPSIPTALWRNKNVQDGTVRFDVLSFSSVSRFWIWFCNSLQIAFSVSWCFRIWTAALTLRSSFLMPYCDTFTEDDVVLKLPPVWRTVRKQILILTIQSENCCWKNN